MARVPKSRDPRQSAQKRIELLELALGFDERAGSRIVGLARQHVDEQTGTFVKDEKRLRGGDLHRLRDGRVGELVCKRANGHAHGSRAQARREQKGHGGHGALRGLALDVPGTGTCDAMRSQGEAFDDMPTLGITRYRVLSLRVF